MVQNLGDVPGVLVSCPGCSAEVPASEIPADPERPFRCVRCRARSGELAAQVVAMQGRSSRAKPIKRNPGGNTPVGSIAESGDGEGDSAAQ